MTDIVHTNLLAKIRAIEGCENFDFTRLSYKEIASILMSVGWRYDKYIKDKQAALEIYYVAMQFAYKADMQSHEWATLFERVFILLRRLKYYQTEVDLLRDVIPKFPYLAKYHKWEYRLSRAALKAKEKHVEYRFPSLPESFI